MIIAECSQNFGNDMELAKKLIRLAKENGADLAKFQLYDEKIGEHPLSFIQARDLFEYGKEVGIEVFFSVFDVERVQWCEKIGVQRYKIACGMRDGEVISAMKASQKPIFISQSSKSNESLLRGDFSNLLCVPEYPAGIQDYDMYLQKFEWYDGISDHTIGLDACKIALVLGAQIIEKHFAIDHKTGVDAEWSMTPDELKELVRWSKVCKEVL